MPSIDLGKMWHRELYQHSLSQKHHLQSVGYLRSNLEYPVLPSQKEDVYLHPDLELWT